MSGIVLICCVLGLLVTPADGQKQTVRVATPMLQVTGGELPPRGEPVHVATPMLQVTGGELPPRGEPVRVATPMLQVTGQ